MKQLGHTEAEAFPVYASATPTYTVHNSGHRSGIYINYCLPYTAAIHFNGHDSKAVHSFGIGKNETSRWER